MTSDDARNESVPSDRVTDAPPPAAAQTPPSTAPVGSVPSDRVTDTAPPPSTVQTPPSSTAVVAAPSTKALRVLSILVMVAGVILIVAGAVTWFVVRDQLADENIVVSDDADRFAGDDVNGPLTAYSEAQTIEKHALEASGGMTYAELAQDDPVRQTVMTASFLRASLFTSVVSFGVAAFAAAVGVLMIIIGYALLRIAKAMGAVMVAVAAAR